MSFGVPGSRKEQPQENPDLEGGMLSWDMPPPHQPRSFSILCFENADRRAASWPKRSWRILSPFLESQRWAPLLQPLGITLHSVLASFEGFCPRAAVALSLYLLSVPCRVAA